MRFLILVLGALALAQCASRGEDDFTTGQSDRALVIIGVAEAAESTEGHYLMLWRRLDSAGGFEDIDGRNAFEAETNSGGTVRVRGIPGEFAMRTVDPGVYALDSVFAIIPDGRVRYVADGVIRGPERPAFEVQAGEAVYLGIWQMRIEDARAVTRPWRLSEEDLRSVLRNNDAVLGDVRVRQTHTRAVTCQPRQINSRSRRQVC